MNIKGIKPAAAMVAGGLLLGTTPAHAGGKLVIDDTKWISIGAGLRTGFSAIEDQAPNGKDWSKEFAVDSARIYVAGQIHKYVKFTFNTECIFCNDEALRDFHVLDAIGQFEFMPEFNVWFGRMLVPSDRAEMAGPFYANTYDFNKTPFYSSDYSVKFGKGGAGVYGRDNGATVWGKLFDQRLVYAAGVFSGLNSATGTGPNQNDDLLYAASLRYNFLGIEPAPAYYLGNTYYGAAGDILTLGFAVQYQANGAGTFAHPGDFTGYNIDMLFEKVLGDQSVLTFEGEYKNFSADYSVLAFGDLDPNAFLMFDGDAYTMTGLYLFPQVIGIGKFQPYVRYTGVDPSHSAFRQEIEGGVNYIIDGTNARISVFYEHGDIATKGLNYAPTASGEKVDAIKVGLQLQI